MKIQIKISIKIGEFYQNPTPSITWPLLAIGKKRNW